MNKLEIKIDNVDYTKKTILPIKGAILLDERLDELNFSVRNVNLAIPFRPLTPIEITIINSPECLVLGEKENVDSSITQDYNATTHRLTQTRVIKMIVARDNIQECPVGSGFFIHDIYAIEKTKILEGFIGDTLLFTNPLGNDYSNSPASYFATQEGLFTIKSVDVDDLYKSAYEPKSTTFKADFSQAMSVKLGYNGNIYQPLPFTSGEIRTTENGYIQRVQCRLLDENLTELAKKIEYADELTEGSRYRQPKALQDIVYDFSSSLGKTFYIETFFQYAISIGGSTQATNVTVKFGFHIVENRLPLKKWTCKTVIERILDEIEPLYKKISILDPYEDKPRFILDPGIAPMLDKIIAPDFPLTRMTLREQLKEVGKFIHAEPRLISKVINEEVNDNVITFDFYGSMEPAEIDINKRISMQANQDINEFCTGLDSKAENLVNRLNPFEGVEIEPANGNFKTLRCETTTVRMTEYNNTIIETAKPIDNVANSNYSLYVSLPTGVNDNGEPTGWTVERDITAYLFEKADYDLLSSYDGEYPYNKAFALYYEQGKKNIKGLFFKNPDAVNPFFKNYAIVNILKKVGFTDDQINVVKSHYPLLAFRVAYIPRFSERIYTNKSIIINSSYPRTRIYNQGSNLVETKFYSENLKGAVARLGNVEKILTFKVGFLSGIPKVGTLYNNDYYISAVYFEIRTFFIKVTVYLSKDFNRLSEFIGVSSDIRQWEVSEKQAFERQILLNSYFVITYTKNDTTVGEKSLINKNTVSNLRHYLNTTNTETIYKAEMARLSFYSKKGNKIGESVLATPIATAFANSICMLFNFEDNYSVGQKSSYLKNNEKPDVSGYYGTYEKYGDHYGRAYYCDVTIGCLDHACRAINEMKFPLGNPYMEPYFSTEVGTLNQSYKLRKDSREILSFSNQINFVTDCDIIIGSGLLEKNPLVTGINPQLKLYVLDNRINKFDTSIDLENRSDGINIETISVIERPGDPPIYYTTCFDLADVTANKSGKAWAICTPYHEYKQLVENEDGEQEEQIISYGGNIVLARNIDINNGDTIKLPRFYTKKKLY